MEEMTYREIIKIYTYLINFYGLENQFYIGDYPYMFRKGYTVWVEGNQKSLDSKPIIYDFNKNGFSECDYIYLACAQYYDMQNFRFEKKWNFYYPSTYTKFYSDGLHDVMVEHYNKIKLFNDLQNELKTNNKKEKRIKI